MSNIQRIKKLMMISEQEQRPVTTPLNVDSLVSLLQYINGTNPELFEGVDDYNDIMDYGYNSSNVALQLGKSLDKYGRLFVLPNKFDSDDFDFITTFILENKDKILEGEKDSSNYIIPKQKTFLIVAEESYTGNKSDIYELRESAYNVQYLKELIANNEIMVSDGKFIREEWGDTWDLEQTILEFKEIEPENKNVNEQVDLDTYEPKFTSEEFVDYVNSEFDIEMLEIMQSVIQKRISDLKTLQYFATRKEVKGFRK
jgi:hypothetical protein